MDDYTVNPMISVEEVISWLHRPNPNPEDSTKIRLLRLGNEIFYHDCSQADHVNDILKKVKGRLLEVSFD